MKISILAFCGVLFLAGVSAAAQQPSADAARMSAARAQNREAEQARTVLDQAKQLNDNKVYWCHYINQPGCTSYSDSLPQFAVPK